MKDLKIEELKKIEPKLTNGVFELSEEQDDGSFYNVKITISDDLFSVDLRNNPKKETGLIHQQYVFL